MNNRIKLIIKHPSIIFKSIINSFKYSPLKIFNIPILTAGKTIIRLEKKSKLIIEERVWIGVFESRLGEIYQIANELTVFQLKKYANCYIGKNVAIAPGCKIIVGPSANLIIGEQTMITGSSKIICKEYISIGKKCFISWDVQIMDTDFHKLINNSHYNNETIPIYIGDNVWIGSGVKIMKGVKIGNGCVIGAGSIVTKDIPDRCLAVGIPAKTIKENIQWEV